MNTSMVEPEVSVGKTEYDTDNVKWSPSDGYPRRMAYFMQHSANDREQWRLLEEWEKNVSLREVIKPVIKNSMLIKFNIPSREKYEEAKKKLAESQLQH